MKKKKAMVAVISGILIVAAAVIGIVKYCDSKTSAKYHTKLSEAEKYLNEEEYEKAENAYLQAIDIEPKKDDAYLQVADLYVSQEQYDDAENILQQGEELAESKKIQMKLKQVKPYGLYDEYIQNTITPAIGLADVDEQKSVPNLKTGLVSAEIGDFNKDEIPDLLTVAYADERIMITLYTCKNDKVTELDSVEEDYKFSYAEASKVNVFLKEHDDKSYLIIGEEYIMSGSSDVVSKVFEINEKLEKQCEIAAMEDIMDYTYKLNNKVIAEFDEQYEEYDGNEDSYSRKQKNGIYTLAKAFEPYGIESDRLIYKNDYGVKLDRAKCDENDDTESYIAYFQTGYYTSEHSIEFSGGDKLKMEDKTGVRSRIK